MTIGEKLKKLRGSKTMTEMARDIGITTTSLWNYENNYRVPKDEVKKKIAIYFKKTVDEIFFNSLLH